MTNIHHIQPQEFQKEVIDHQGKVLVDFFAPWCGPCRMMEPAIEAVGAEHTDLKIVKVNVDEAGDVAMKYGVSSIPNFLVFENGQVVNQAVGAVGKDGLERIV